MFSLINIILLPLLAFFTYKSTIKISKRMSYIFMTIGIIMYLYLLFFDASAITKYGLRFLISPIYYIIISYFLLHTLNKSFKNPIQSLSSSFLLVWTIKDFWELPCYINGIILGTWTDITVYKYIFSSIFGLILLYFIFKPKIKKFYILIIGTIILYIMNFIFSSYYVPLPYNEIYWMIGRIICTITLYKTLIRSNKNV